MNKKNADSGFVTADALRQHAEQAHALVVTHPEAFRPFATWYQSVELTGSDNLPVSEMEPHCRRVMCALRDVTGRFLGRPPGERMWDMTVDDALAITLVTAGLDPGFDSRALDLPWVPWETTRTTCGLAGGRRGAAALLAGTADMWDRTWVDLPWCLMPEALRIARKNAATHPANEAYGAAAEFVEHLGVLAFHARVLQTRSDISERWQDLGASYGYAFIAWFDLGGLLTPYVQSAARRVYSPDRLAIKIGKFRATATVIDAVRGELGVAFRNLLYQDRPCPLDPDTDRIAAEARARATKRQVAQGNSATDFGWGVDYKELMRLETCAAVRKRLGIKTHLDGVGYMANEWKAQKPGDAMRVLSMLCLESIDFDNLRTQLDREAQAVLDRCRLASTADASAGSRGHFGDSTSFAKSDAPKGDVTPPPTEEHHRKPGGWTKKELVDEVKDRVSFSASAFDRIRRAAKVRPSAKGGKGQNRKFSKAELRKLINAVEEGTSRKKMEIGRAWRNLLD